MRKERVAEMFAGKAQIFESVEVQLIMWSGISYLEVLSMYSPLHI